MLPGDEIQTSQDFMSGSGTYTKNGKIFSTLWGHVKYTDWLVQVIPVKKRYMPDTGDIVVGWIVSVENKFWKVDINGSQHASLSLQAINIKGE